VARWWASSSTSSSTNNAPVPGAGKEENTSEAKEDEESPNLSLPVSDEASSLSLEENAAADTAGDWEDEDFDIDLGPAIEGILNGSKWPEKARELFSDPTWQKDRNHADERARWAAFFADDELEKAEKEKANREFARR